MSSKSHAEESIIGLFVLCCLSFSFFWLVYSIPRTGFHGLVGFMALIREMAKIFLMESSRGFSGTVDFHMGVGSVRLPTEDLQDEIC